MVAHPEPPVETGPEAGYDELPDNVEQLKAMVLAERARAARLEHILTGGLLELARDLINYAYRNYIREVAFQGASMMPPLSPPPSSGV